MINAGCRINNRGGIVIDLWVFISENCCVVGAGSVVTKSVEPFAIVAGNPARKIGERPRDLSYSTDHRRLFQ